MKTLILVRHAKSSWKDSSIRDIKRPLNKRGLRDAPFMGNLLKGTGIIVSRFISSPANRALTTAKFFAAAYGLHERDIMIKDLIYHESGRSIMSFIASLDDNLETVALFGHNPDITSMASMLTNEYFSNVPTCGLVCIDFNTDSWQNTGESLGKLRFFKYPKMYFKK
jgi:phosphohistidine phosphatase